MAEVPAKVPAPKPPPVPKPKGGLGKKIGPLPVWVWAALLVGGIGFVLYIRSKTGAQTADVTPAGANVPAQQSGIFAGGGGPPAAPANGVVRISEDGLHTPCPTGFHYVAGACVPNVAVGTVGAHNPPGFIGPPIHPPPDHPPGFLGPPIPGPPPADVSEG